MNAQFLAGAADILDTWWGMLLFILFDAVVLVFILALNYKWLCKRLLDILFAALFLLAFFPFFLLFLAADAVYVRASNAYPSVFVSAVYCGKKRRPVKLTVFATERTLRDEAGALLPEKERVTPFGRVLKACGMKYYPCLWQVLAGRLSFVGPRPFTFADAAAVGESGEARFSVRPGLVTSLERYGGEKLTYPDMLEEDAEYAARHGLFRDISFFVAKIAHRLRGDGPHRVFGECAGRTYLQWLQDTGAITASEAALYEADGEAALRRSGKNEREDFARGGTKPLQ